VVSTVDTYIMHTCRVARAIVHYAIDDVDDYHGRKVWAATRCFTLPSKTLTTNCLLIYCGIRQSTSTCRHTGVSQLSTSPAASSPLGRRWFRGCELSPPSTRLASLTNSRIRQLPALMRAVRR